MNQDHRVAAGMADGLCREFGDDSEACRREVLCDPASPFAKVNHPICKETEACHAGESSSIRTIFVTSSG
jgi:hypothetical protein